ncbi:MAG: hypothetical protein QM751_04655 [Paludibacteraceae bacterium]
MPHLRQLKSMRYILLMIISPYVRLVNIFTTLVPILNQVQELAEGLQKSVTAAGSDSLVAALEVYAAIKQHKDKVSGLSVMHDEMLPFFKKTKSKTHGES